jgi:hypothetical protein
MTQACQRLKPRIHQHCKFLQTLSEICLKSVVNRAVNRSPVYVTGCSLQHDILKLR